jgi:hypothetical protein
VSAAPERVGRLGDEGHVSKLGEWGPIMHGGAWLTVGGTPIDVLLRELDTIEHWCDEAQGSFEALSQNGLHRRRSCLPTRRRARALPTDRRRATAPELPVGVLVTIGDQRDPAELGAGTPSVRVKRCVAQREVMPHAAVMVGHGGRLDARGTGRRSPDGAYPAVRRPRRRHRGRRWRRCGAAARGPRRTAAQRSELPTQLGRAHR